MIGLPLEDVKYNCDVSDARYWGYFSICGLLMRYRDLYRSERGLAPWEPVDREAIGLWIQRKEARWPELEDRSFRDLSAGGTKLDPFDLDSVNTVLGSQGHVYGAGYGMYLKPTFFVARIRAVTEVDGHRIITTDRELTRDLFASPAMLQGRRIFLRLEPLRAVLWDRFVQIAPGRCASLADAFRAFGIQPGCSVDGAFETALDRMVGLYAEVLLRHELAESFETVPDWKSILAEIHDRKVELYMRAVQDVLADTSERGPLRRIIQDRDERVLALFVGVMDGYRRVLFPELRDAYDRHVRDHDWDLLDEVRRRCHARLVESRRTLLAIAGREDREEALEKIRRLMPE